MFLCLLMWWAEQAVADDVSVETKDQHQLDISRKPLVVDVDNNVTTGLAPVSSDLSNSLPPFQVMPLLYSLHISDYIVAKNPYRLSWQFILRYRESNSGISWILHNNDGRHGKNNNNKNNKRICIVPVCRLTSEALNRQQQPAPLILTVMLQL